MENINKKYLYNMLRIIDKKRPIKDLIDLGLDYSQIANLISELLSLEYITDDDETGLILTGSGKEELNKLSDMLPEIKSSDWINPMVDQRVTKIGKYDIYIPEKKGLQKKP